MTMQTISWRHAQLIMWPLSQRKGMQAVRWMVLNANRVDTASVCITGHRKSVQNARKPVRAKRALVKHQQSATLCAMTYL